jgi:peptidoglycan hydrolase-like protein with peptidoglycan-binding domain/GH25 family lysozyme M1 (1,4-beta-N-acetylmuramidase)
MGHIVDISKHQPSEKIDWAKFTKDMDLLIFRVQYGSSVPDIEYKNHVANAKKFNVPFMSYAFPEFVSVEDARVEARNAVARQDKDSLAMILDVETEYGKNSQPLGITKLPQSVRLEGIKAFVDELRKLGVKKVGAYVAHNVYDSWQFDTIAQLFDFVWIPKYGANDGKMHTPPSYPHHLWQFSSVGKVDGYEGNLDVSCISGDKTLDWFLGKEDVPQSHPEATIVVKPIEVKKPIPKHAVFDTLHIGAKGNIVKELQAFLNKYGYKVSIDGDFGGKTEDAIKNFQKKHNLTVDGIVGLNTWTELHKPIPTPKPAPKPVPKPAPKPVLKPVVKPAPAPKPELKKGDNGSSVKELQTKLNKFGYKLTVDGDFGDNTEKAVKAFQKKNKLSVDGVVGKNTWTKLK